MIRMTAKIVSAYVRGNAVSASDVASLIQSIYEGLVHAQAPETETIVSQPQPAVPVRKSVQPDAIICLECGKPQKMLKRHLRVRHDLSVPEYRAKWSLTVDYPVVAPAYAEQRSELARTIGLGRKPKSAPQEQAEKPGYRYPASRWSKPSA